MLWKRPRIVVPLHTEPHTAHVSVFIFVLVRASSRFPQSLQKTKEPIAVILNSATRSLGCREGLLSDNRKVLGMKHGKVW